MTEENQSVSEPATALDDTRGSVFVEYIIVVAFAALLMIAFFGPRVGSKMATEYTSQRAALYSATP
jgi:Flp pilus assembly pilin Flp